MNLSFLKRILPNVVSKNLQVFRSNYALRQIIKQQENSGEFLDRRRFYQQILKKGDTVFDIGANYGNRIGPILKIGVRKLIAVEPQHQCCEHLKRFYPGIEILQKGVGAEKGQKELFISDQDVLSSFSEEFITLTKAGRFSTSEWNKKELVEIITLDDLIRDYGIPDFIKIDVEGYELEVLSGLTQKVRLLSFEYTTPELAHKLNPILDKLQSLGEIEINYSIAESMELELKTWISYNAGIVLIKSDEFLKTGFGDIYIRFK